MTILDEVQGLFNGAGFFRADLHIHSFGGSHDVKDTSITPDGIVKTAETENLDIIAITDHNEISNVEATIKAAAGKQILVLPAIELSTPTGHLLCYLPTLPSLQTFHGRLSFADRGTQSSRCQTAMLECLNLIHQLGGFGILAHVDGGGVFEQELPGGSPHKVDVICHPALLGIELKSATSDISYSDLDPDPVRMQAGKQRITRLGLGGRQFLARVLNSDAHSLSALGKNAQGARKVTRIKMDQPSFEGIRIALQDSDARIRIEDHLLQAVPTVLGIHLDGGFLDGQTVHFSPNLNCIIGGRGTGKSTMFEAVRCLSGIESNNPVIDSDIWPSELHLFWRDPAGQIHTLYRVSGGALENTDDPMMGPMSFEIDCFGQGETARISQQAESNPIALLSYLDRFVDLADASAAEAEVRDRLLSLQTEIEKAREKVDLIPQYERSLATAKQQLSALEKAKTMSRALLELSSGDIVS